MRKASDKSKKRKRTDEGVPSQLERLVADQNRQLTAVHDELTKAIADRKRAQQAISFLAAVVESSHDAITEHKEAEARNAYHASLLTSAPDVVLATDDQFNLTVTSARQRFGSSWAKVQMTLQATEVRVSVESNLAVDASLRNVIGDSMEMAPELRSLQERIHRLDGQIAFRKEERRAILEASFPLFHTAATGG